MGSQTIMEKLEILADAAKYDASCASSGTAKKNSLGGPEGPVGCGLCWAARPGSPGSDRATS